LAAFGVMGADPKADKAAKVWRAICERVECSEVSESAPPTFTRRDAHQWCRRLFPGGVDELDPVLDLLERHNLIRPVPGAGQPGRGHRSPAYQVHAAALEEARLEAPRTH
jgi:hypothetical protein